MKVSVIKQLVQQYDEASLAAAEQAIENGQQPSIPIEGNDEGEQLTHVIAARWVLQRIQQENISLSEALRAYAQMVRNSIS